MPIIKLVMDYGNLSYHEALQLPTDTFYFMVKQQVLTRLNETEEGRQYIADCERYNVTEPDMEALRNVFPVQQVGNNGI